MQNIQTILKIMLAVEVFDSRDPAIQLNILKPHNENLLKDLLAKMSCFMFQMTS